MHVHTCTDSYLSSPVGIVRQDGTVRGRDIVFPRGCSTVSHGANMLTALLLPPAMYLYGNTYSDASETSESS